MADEEPDPTLTQDVARLEKLLAKRRMGMDAWIAWTDDEIAAADHIANLFPREHLADRAFAAANLIVTKILAGQVEIKGREIAPTLRALIDIARLESNEPTEVKAELSADERREYVERLRARVAERLGPAPDDVIDAEVEP